MITESKNNGEKASPDPFELVRKIKGRGPAPVHLWNPPFCGELDMLIRKDGSWIHEGKLIRRQAMVELFASVLMLAEDGEYYLVTPVEKVRIKVEDCPFVILDMDVEGQNDSQALSFTTNVGEVVVAAKGHELRIDADSAEPHPVLHVRSGLYGLINRAVFYRLVELAQQVESPSGELVTGIWSSGEFFEIAS